MASMEFSRVGVMGGGLMGSGIAEVSAHAGLDVIVVDIDEPAVEAARGRVLRSLGQAVQRGKLSDDARDRDRGADRVHVESRGPRRV